MWPIYAHFPFFADAFQEFQEEKRWFSSSHRFIMSNSTTMAIPRAFQTLANTKRRCLVAFSCSGGDWWWSNTTSSVPIGLPEIPHEDLREHLDSHRTTTVCREPAKLFIDDPSNIIYERWWYATAVIGRFMSPNSLIFAVFTVPNFFRKKIWAIFQAWSAPSAAPIGITNISQLVKSTKGI